MNKSSEIDLDKRLEYMEQANIFKMMALDLAKELGEFNSSISRLESRDTIFENCQVRARQIIGFEQVAFYLVNEEDSEFYLYSSDPDLQKELLEREMDVLIDDGTFSRAVMTKEPVTAYLRESDEQVLLHALATASRVRGMFVGVLAKKSKHIQEAALELFSILMTHCANALESYELYHQLRASNDRLQKKVEQLSRSQFFLQKEIVEHEKTGAALEASERQYRLLAETAREVIILTSEDLNIIYANPSALTTCRYGSSGMIGVAVTTLIHDFHAVLEKSLKMDASSTQIVQVTSKCGEQIPLEINMVPIPNVSGGYMLIGRDISERLKAEEERTFLEAKLWQVQKMESIGLLASGISHDFSNILSVILNYTALSVARIEKENPVRGYLENVQKATDRAILLARKLYTIGRRDEHQTAKINVVETIRETLDLLKSSLDKNISVTTDFETDSLVVLAEETRIQQILMNLITNAGHALKRQSGTIRVTAARVNVSRNTPLSILDLKTGDYINICVSDDGPGIETDVCQRIFEPYFSTKTGKENSGLGLSVVHGIVKNYKGGIDIDTELGKGTTFCIYLPEYRP